MCLRRRRGPLPFSTYSAAKEMRPDKKKTRHHDSRKREAAAKSKLAGESSSSAATKAKGKGSSSDRAPEEEEGSHSEEKQEDVGDDRYSKRKVQSNWTKYEIPSSEGEDDEGDDEEDEREMTGPDFNYVLQNASTSSSLFRLRSEREWEEEQTLFVNNDLFALDLLGLEAAAATVPTHRQLEMDPGELGDESLAAAFEARALDARAAREEYLRRKGLLDGGVGGENPPASSAQDINAEMLEKLKLAGESPKKKKSVPAGASGPSPEALATKNQKADDAATAGEGKQKEIADLEEWLDDFLEEC